MNLQVSNIRISLKESVSIENNIEKLKSYCAKKLDISRSDIKNLRIIKESVDARRKDLSFVYSVIIETNRNIKNVDHKDNVKIYSGKKKNRDVYGDKKIKNRPVIVGMGPAGVFAGLVLVSNGYNPLILERGEKVEDRIKKVDKFWKTNELDIESNVQFGEGGAGTFSDGKLTTRINDKRQDFIIEKFVEFGAPREISYKSKPHIGTDKLRSVIKNMREYIVKNGGEVRFNCKISDIKISNEKLYSLITADKEEIPVEAAIFSIGHSARDTYEMLFKKGIKIDQKPFSIGVRIEHLQEYIDYIQFKEYASHPMLKAADYRLVSKDNNRTCYSFCMCPGGYVIASASEKETVVTNGMSLFNRTGKNANSAIVVSVFPKDFESAHPLAGIEFQRKWERTSFVEGGSNYNAPVQLVEDFINSKKSTKLLQVKPTYTGNIVLSDLNNCLPEYVCETLKKGLYDFNNKIKGFAQNGAVLTGVETRTSAPVRIVRNENGESVSVKGIYPCGEGAGYAGGIVSSAVDGIKIAELIMKEYSPLK